MNIKIKLNRLQKRVIIITTALMGIGAVFSYSLPIFLEIQKSLSPFHFFVRYLLFCVISLTVIITLSQIDSKKFFNILGFSLFFISLITIIAIPFLPSQFAPVIKGAKRWIQINHFYIAPVEFFKIGFIFFISWSFTRKISHFKDKHLSFKEAFLKILPYLSLAGITWVIIMFFLSDFGQVIVMFVIFLLMLIIAGANRKSIYITIGIIGIGLIAAVVAKPYRIKRILEWITHISNSQAADKNLNAIQINESLNAIYHGELSGVGLGGGVFKLGFLSDIHNDFVLAGISEEVGFMGIVVIAFLIISLIYNILLISIKSKNKEFYLFGFGIASLIMIHFTLNSLGISAVIPLKGLTIPFISYGGSSMIAMSIGIGMVLMISKNNEKYEDKK